MAHYRGTGEREDFIDACEQLIGTHTHEIEDGLGKLFTSLGWVSQYGAPLDGYINVKGKLVEIGDGAQSWINPALA